MIDKKPYATIVVVWNSCHLAKYLYQQVTYHDI